MRHEEINFHSSVPSRLTLSPFRSHASRFEGNVSGDQERDDSSEPDGRIPRCALLCCSPNKPVIQEEIERVCLAQSSTLLLDVTLFVLKMIKPCHRDARRNASKEVAFDSGKRDPGDTRSSATVTMAPRYLIQ